MSESHNDELVIDFGTHHPHFGTHTPDFGDDIAGDVDVIHTGPSALDMLNSEPLEEDYGVGTPEGDLPEFGVMGAVEETHSGPDELELLDDAPLEEDYGTHEPDFGTGAPDAGTGGDPDEIVENRMLLNFGGDIPDATDEEEFDFGDEIPGVNEINGIPPDVAFDMEMLGEDVAPSEEYILQREAAAFPLTRVVDKKTTLKEWQLDFGPVWGPAGAQTVITISPQCLFRGEKILATDTDNGLSTRIIQVAVGQKIQKPGNIGKGTSTQFFAQNALGNGINFDTAQRWARVAVTVSFVNACTFDMTVFGKAVVDW